MPIKKLKSRKPPYRVPLMREIARMRGSAGLTAASTFSGGGGSTLGLEMAGFSVLWASEFFEHARLAHEANHPDTPVDGRDIRDVSAADVLRAAGLRRGELDLLEGSPPCDSFSTSGKRERLWGQEKKYSGGRRQRTDDLFMEFARLLRGLRPRAFVAENVTGLVKGVAKGYFKIILAELKRCGYRVEARVLDAQWLGVPQVRKRVIFVGVRRDVGAEPAFPAPLRHRYSVADACPWMAENKIVIGNDKCVPNARGNAFIVGRGIRRGSDQPAPTITAGGDSVAGAAYSIEGTAIGREALKLGPGQKSGKYQNLVRAELGKPSPTILATHGAKGIASVIHPTEQRKFTIAELKRICGFPDDFELTGSRANQWRVLGMAVPPPMMRAVAEAIRDEVLVKKTPGGGRRGR